MKKSGNGLLLLKSIKTILIFLYLFFELNTMRFLGRQDSHLFEMESIICGVLAALIVTFGGLAIQSGVPRRILSALFRKEESLGVIKKLFVIAIPLIVGILICIAYFPGCFSYDSINQIEQGLTGEYNNWHPYLQTLVFYALPLWVSNDWSGSVFIFQIIFFVFSVAFVAVRILRYGNFLTAIFFDMLIVLNPVTLWILPFVWKDVSFACSALMLMGFLMDIIFSGEGWLNSKTHVIVLIAAILMCTFFRHNGCLFTVPFSIFVLLKMHKKQRVMFGLWMAAAFLFLQLLLPYVMRVGRAGYRKTESLGFCMVILGNAFVENADLLDEKTKSFLINVADEDVWKNYYICGSFNSIKNEHDINRKAIENEGVISIAMMTFRTILRTPTSSLRGALTLSNMTLGFGTKVYADTKHDIIQNDYDIEYKGNNAVKSFFEGYEQFFNVGSLKYFFLFIGVWLFNVLVIGLLFLDTWERMGFFVILSAILPTTLYHMGTTVLLTGFDYRFFFISYLTLPVAGFIILKYHMRKET